MTEVDRFFEYTEFLEDKNVKCVAYKLKGRASVCLDRLTEMRMREWQGPVQTWCITGEKNSFFMKKGKTVIFVRNRKFSRSQTTKWTSSLSSSPEI